MPENMKRKITVETSTSKSTTSNDTLRRPSVFERLGTKAASSTTTSSTTVPAVTVGIESSSSCRHWGLTGSCPYGKSCKNASSHALISPSKQRAAKKDNDPKPKTPVANLKPLSNSAKDELNKRLHSAVIKKRTGASPDLNWENWDQTDLEYEDEKVLEKRRRLLQRELELQMSQEKEEQQKSQEKEDQQKKKKVKKVKKGVSSSSSTSGSSSSSSESSSSSDESSSSSSSTSADSRRKKMKPKTGKRDSSSSTSGADRKKKISSKSTKSGSVPPGMKKALPARKEEQRPQSSKKRESSIPKKPSTQLPSHPTSTNKNRSTGSPSRNRHRSQSPQHSNDKNKSTLNTKSKAGAGHNLSPKRSQSADKKDRRNNSGSPRPSIRDRDREREKERDRERDKIKEKERDKERERDRDKDSGKSRGRDKSQSPGPNSRGKDGASSPRRRPIPRDSRRRESPDMGVAKERSRQTSPVKSRRSGSRGRSSLNSKHPSSGREADRRESNHDTRDKNGGTKKPDVRRGESMLKGGKGNDSSDTKGNGSRSKDEQDKTRRAADSSSSKSSSKKTLPVTSTNKSTQDRDKDRNSNKDPRDVSRDSKESRDRDGRDNSDPRLSRNTKTLREREAAREKEREEALERCRERQRERERKAREEKARDEKIREEKAREEKAREHERELPSLLMIATHNPIKSSRNTGSEGSKDKGSERGSDRDRDSDKTIDRSRRADRSMERNLNRSADRSDRDRGPERDRDRVDRHVDRDHSFDRAPDHERGIVRGPSDRDRIPERDRGFERDPDRSLNKDSRSNNRSFDRSTERNFDRDSGRFDHGHLERDNHSDREYAGLPPRGRDDRRPLGLDEKSVSGYDSPYEARRGREERPRYGEPMERGRYDEPVMSREDQRRSGDIRNYSDERRGHREARSSLEPGWATRNDRRSPNKSRDYEPRSPIKSRDYGSRSPNKSRDYEPRSPNKSRDYEPRSPNKSHDYESRSPLIKGRDYEPRSPCHSLKGRDWDSRDYGDSRREWDGRGGRRGPQLDWDNQHRSDWPDKEGPRPGMDDDWDMYGGQRDWPPGGGDRWTEEWDRPGRSSSGPPPRAPLDYVMPSPRDVKPDAPSLDERKDPSLDVSSTSDKLPAKPEEPTVKEASSETLKRPRESTDGDPDKPEAKKICLEESLPLEEDLSDISDDDADEILNREDIEMASNLAQQDQLSSAPPSGIAVGGLGEQLEAERDKDVDKTIEKMVIEPCRDSSEQHSLIAADDETVDSLDFEEISDEELEEEARAGLGDALGVDWASLVAEQKPRVRNELQPGSARRRWDGHRMLARVGVSVRYLGQDMVDEISAKLAEIAKEDGEEAEESGFLHPVASIHVSLREKKERRKELFTSAGPYRRALSARRDLLVRRQLCGLPVKETTVDSQGPNTEEIFRLAVQLFERGV